MFKKNIWLVVLLAVISLSWACDGGQTDEANKLVNEGNDITNKTNEGIIKASNLTKELLGENMTKAEDLEKYKADNKAKFDELVKLSEQNEKGFNDAAAKFEQAAKLKVDDKFKEYLNVRAQEFKKRAEIEKADNTFVKAFLAEKEAEKADALIGDSNKKSDGLKKEADDLKAKSEKIVKDNPTLFK
jgi:hypothetical protein